MSEVQDQKGEPIQIITSQIVKLSGLVAAVVTFNTSLTTCSNDNIQRHKIFRESVKSEEEHWEKLYAQYLSAFDPKVTPKDQQDKKLFAITAFAGHVAPDFSEHKLGPWWDRDEKSVKEGAKHLNSLRNKLLDALTNSDASGSAVAAKAQGEIFDRDEKLATSLKSVNEAKTAQEASRVGQPVANYAARTLTFGNENGWDIDVFWCAGAEETEENQRKATAYRLGGLLADPTPKPKLGFVTGRIRVRALPVSRQGEGSGYPSAGFIVRGETVETTDARRLSAFLFDSGKLRFTLETSRMVTPHYLSVFVCS